MATGRIRRSARRGLAAIVLGWLAILVGSVLMAPSASAEATARVDIRDLTPPLVSVDAGGKVTFANAIEDKTVQVGGGGLLPSLVTVVVHTDVTLGLPSGSHGLQKGQEWAETFPQSCVGCTITYTYRATVPDGSVVGSVLNTVTGQALATLPQNQTLAYNGKQTTVTIGVPTPFLVNTLLPLPNLPSVNLPQLPPVTVQVPGVGGLPAAGGTTTPLPGQQTTTTTTTTGTTAQSVPGTQYTYDTGAGAPQMAPVDTAAAAAFDPSRFVAAGSGAGTADRSSGSAGGSGGVAGGYDGASVPVFGQLAGLDGSNLDEADSSVAAPGSASNPALPVPALAAVVALAAVTAALVRSHQATRAMKPVRRGR